MRHNGDHRPAPIGADLRIGGLLCAALLAVTRLLAASQEEALTDSLTGLGNRRRFVSDVETLLVEQGADNPVSLTVFDLDGFKTYNDSFGHAAGDALLGRVASRLADATDGYGTAYRLGGDEFCVLASAATGSLVERSAAALSEEGEGFSVRCSHGSVLLPTEASDLTEALRIADDRMYLHKQRNRPSADRQSIDVLVSLLSERDSQLAQRLAGVAGLVEAASPGLEVSEPQLRALRQAAELHDVGKLAIPEEILGKPGPLSDDEWEFVRRHPLIGERILGAAPALGAAAKLVRSTHERWDGTGYPDRLAGSEIPLGARIIAVCDAFDAMTSPRPYAEPLNAEHAIRELFRCAGTQFDPEVVEAFAAQQADLNAEHVA